MTLDQFQPLIGQTFTLSYPDYSEKLTLVEAEELKYTPLPGLPKGFILIFAGESLTTMLGQATYTLENSTLGQVELFLSCIGPNPNGTLQYQCIIN